MFEYNGGKWIVCVLQDEKIILRHHLLTHAHIDHVLGCNFIFTKFGLNPRFYELDRTLYEFAPGIAIKYGLPTLQLPESGPTIRLDERITLGSLQFEVLFTPGHSPGSVCFYNAEYHRIFLVTSCLKVVSAGQIYLEIINNCLILYNKNYSHCHRKLKSIQVMVV